MGVAEEKVILWARWQVLQTGSTGSTLTLSVLGQVLPVGSQSVTSIPALGHREGPHVLTYLARYMYTNAQKTHWQYLAQSLIRRRTEQSLSLLILSSQGRSERSRNQLLFLRGNRWPPPVLTLLEGTAPGSSSQTAGRSRAGVTTAPLPNRLNATPARPFLAV